jgi:aerobic-type carbon monoxide dehydrogenase small subunit (CoxS/CutS family)
MNGDVEITCTVNGVPWHGRAPVGGSLLDLLRGPLGLTGAKRGCEMLACGVCTVLIDGRPVSACGMFASDLDGTAMRTVEGLAPGGELSDLQRAFADRVAAQCGYCTSGQLMTATALIETHAELTRADIRDWMRTNLCRCGSYAGIVEAVEAAHEAYWSDRRAQTRKDQA